MSRSQAQDVVGNHTARSCGDEEADGGGFGIETRLPIGWAAVVSAAVSALLWGAILTPFSLL
jgi:hypothetical protein